MYHELDLIFPYLFNIVQKFQSQLPSNYYLAPYQSKYFQALSLDELCLDYDNKKQLTKLIK
jgi:hypothetical protein